jgi:putative ABC transport system ATP-binding protein
MSSIIQLEHVEQWYNKGKQNEVHALKDITLEIAQGDYVSFFGPSGCGKTTLLYATSGIDRVGGGKILIKGRDITQFNNQELAIFRQTGIGIVFQQFNLVPSLTVLENVALPMAFVGISKEKALTEARKLVERLSIQEYAHHYPTELSGGQQQRVGIARALANNPPILIADEPLGNLDSANAKNVLDILRDLNEKDGRTIIMVTHEAWSLQDVRTIFHMKDGSICSVEHRDQLSIGAAHGGKALEDSSTGKTSSQEFIKKQLEKEARKSEDLHMSARILANFFMRGHSYEESERFESLVIDRFEMKLDSITFKNLLSSPFEKGGVDLWKRKAEKATSYIEEIIEKRKNLDTIIEEMNINPQMPIDEEVWELRKFMVQEYVGEISYYRAEILDELIADRIRRNISSKQFLQLLYRPVKEYGVGVPVHSAQKMAEHLEMVVGGAEDYEPVR